MAKGSKTRRMFTLPKESSTRKRIDTILNNFGWSTDETSTECNVFTERAKTTKQNRALRGYEPDYVLYQSGSDSPIAVIEAKREGKGMKDALDKAITHYAEPLGVYIIFVTDGSIIEAYDRRSGSNLRIDGEIVTDLLSEKQLLRFVREGSDLRTPETVRYTKQELIEVFRRANKWLRKEGLREGVERFTEFSNLLFLKLISEIEQEREARGEKRILRRKYCWEAFCGKPPEEMLDYINDTILPRLVDRYNHSGDVFQSKLLIANAATLKKIVDELSPLSLLDTESDVKGDAFEYFLKNSISVGNDLGEYFTPRHVVKLMVDMVDPRFGEKVYDPACGTGGFLIQAFRHIKNKVQETKKNLEALKKKTVYGRELTGTSKIAKMNMIIIGDGHTNVKQMDSLEFPVRCEYDLVLTNYPFSQKTDYASCYDLSGENANPVFLKHIIDALKVGGRAAVVVPEGLLFDEGSQFTKVRRILLETCNVSAVISLSEYVFRPYTGQPTSILVFEKGPQTESVWFFNVRYDGFEKTTSKLGRRPTPESDLPLLRRLWEDKADSPRSFSVGFDVIKEHKYILTIDEYRKAPAGKNWVPLGGNDGVCEIVIGATPSTRDRTNYGGPHPWATISDITNVEGKYLTDTEKKITSEGIEHSNVKLVKKGTVLFSFKLSPGKVAIAGRDVYTNEAIAALVPKDDRVLPKYLYHILPRLDYSSYTRRAAKGRTMKKRTIKTVLIPLPPRNVQEKIIRDMAQKEAQIRKYREKIARTIAEGDSLLARLTKTRK